MTTEIQPYEKLRDMQSINALGNALAKSGMFGATKVEQGIVLALQCLSENKPPLEMAKHYHIIDGKLSKRADSMLADFRKAGGKFIFKDLKDGKVQEAKVTFEDYKDLKVSYSMDEAKAAGLIRKGSAWEKTPAAMLRARLVSETLRAIAPEIVTGVYTPEEIRDDADAEIMQKAHDAAEDRKAARESKPEPKPVETIDAEVVDDSLIDELKGKIAELERGEIRVNAYWEKKNKIQVDLGQTWQDLPESDLKKMNSKWEQFCEQALKGAK